MAKNTRLTGDNLKASQEGLTSLKLSDSGLLDFRIAVAKNTRGRHVRISCINVTPGLSSVVIISHPNQLHICRTLLFAQSQVLHKCLCESVAYLSRCKYVTSSVVFMFARIVAQMSRCRNVTSSCNYVTVARMSHCCRNVTVVKMSRCQNVSLRSESATSDPSEGICYPSDGNRETLRWKSSPLRGNLLPLRWKMT